MSHVESVNLSELTRPEYVSVRLVQVRTEISERFLEMGELLLEAHRGNYHEALGYVSFEAFVESRLEMKSRRAHYLAACFNVFIEQLNVPRDRVAEIGWTKCKELIPAIEEDTPPPGMPLDSVGLPAQPITKEQLAERWMDYAATHTTGEINLAVRQQQAPIGLREGLRAAKPITFMVFDDEREQVERAVQICLQETSSERMGRALSLICEGYLSEALARQADAMRQVADELPDELPDDPNDGPPIHESDIIETEALPTDFGDDLLGGE